MNLRQYVKNRETPLARFAYAVYRSLTRFEMPAPKSVWKPIYMVHKGVVSFFSLLVQRCYFLPLFKSCCQNSPARLHLYTGMPLIMGNLSIEMGDDCRVSGVTTFSGRASASQTPQFIVGNNCDIGWQNQISVGTRVVLGDNVRLAPRVMLAGYPGHPIDRKDRAAGLPETDDQVGDIILEDDVWLATGVTVLAGVTIGEGTIVGANSTVTGDLPPMCIAAGSPAKVVRRLDEA
ncbi:MAG: acetyltransferase [Desulfovibrio sp.]|nr:acetyltransferase [Desulfovibrio sp.]|tara:strand:+ start:437 stop:1138 length:702 start_codon:yes stop_codon:yes gene_type:complete